MNIRRLAIAPMCAIIVLGGVACGRGKATPTPTQQPAATPVAQTTELPLTESAARGVITEARVIQAVVDVMTIVWKTSVPTTGRLEYGHGEGDYSLTTPWTEGLTTTNGVTVGQLDSFSNYHARVRVKDAAGNETVSGDIFVTLYFYTLPSYGQGEEPGQGGWGSYL